MKRQSPFDEFDFLDLFYEEMIKNGRKHNLIRITINKEIVEYIYEHKPYSVTEKEIEKLADICLANDWLEQKTIGAGQYGNLQLTTTGLGVITSKRRRKEIEDQKSILKKSSDYIEDHKGLFIFLGFMIAAIGLMLKFMKG